MTPTKTFRGRQKMGRFSVEFAVTNYLDVGLAEAGVRPPIKSDVRRFAASWIRERLVLFDLRAWPRRGRDVLSALKKAGFFVARIRGSHHI
jgi:hypothetical protein